MTSTCLSVTCLQANTLHMTALSEVQHSLCDMTRYRRSSHRLSRVSMCVRTPILSHWPIFAKALITYQHLHRIRRHILWHDDAYVSLHLKSSEHSILITNRSFTFPLCLVLLSFGLCNRSLAAALSTDSQNECTTS
jgi:hypothetical protein